MTPELGHLAAPRAFASYLDALLECPIELSAVARRSYRHVNDFLKIVLYGEDTGKHRLTLHIWDVQRADSSGRFHSHRFDFLSAVLCGELKSEYFEVVQHGGELVIEAYEYAAGREPRRQNYTPLEPAILRRKLAITYTPPDIYHMGFNQIHRVSALPNRLTATLVLRSPQKRPVSTVYSGNWPHQINFRSPPLETTECAEQLWNLRRVIESQ